MFMMAQFSPDGIQILTCGTDRKITYWETLDGSLVREIEGSNAGTMNCLDVSPNGRYFITGSNDCTVKIWEYDSADLTHVGTSHAAIITACKFSTDCKHVVTASADGTIMIWKFPLEFLNESRRINQSGRTISSIHSLSNSDVDKLSSQKSESNASVAADQTERSSKTSISSCASDIKSLSIASDRSKDSKKEIRVEKTPICKCVLPSSANSKSKSTLNHCRCKDAKKNKSSSKAKTVKNLKESSDSCSNKSVTVKTS